MRRLVLAAAAAIILAFAPLAGALPASADDCYGCDTAPSAPPPADYSTYTYYVTVGAYGMVFGGTIGAGAYLIYLGCCYTP